MVVAAEDGVDELSISARTRVIEVARRRAPRSTSSSRATLASPRPSWRTSPAAPRRRTPPPRAACSAGEPGPRRDLVLLNAGAAIYVGGGAESLAAGVEKAAAAIDSGAAAELLERLIAGDQLPPPSRLRQSSGNDRAADLGSTGRGGGSPRPGSAGGPRVAPFRARRGPPLQRGAGAPGPLADRRVQAALAQRRRHLRRRPTWPRRSRPTSAAARRRSRCSPTSATSAARSRTCARRRPPATCRSCARTSSSTPTSSTRRRSTAPTRCC